MDWYEEMLTDTQRELYDCIEEMCPEFTKLDASKCQQFMDELEDIGITDADVFESAYMYQTDAHNAEAEYAQYVHEEMMCTDALIRLPLIGRLRMTIHSSTTLS